MHIVAVAWLYVVILMAFTQPTLLHGLATFIFYGLAPLLLFWYIVGARARRAARTRKASMSGRTDELADQPDAQDPKADQ